jgi:hypothetical protein
VAEVRAVFVAYLVLICTGLGYLLAIALRHA